MRNSRCAASAAAPDARYLGHLLDRSGMQIASKTQLI